jgi:nucleoside phosphorylase
MSSKFATVVCIVCHLFNSPFFSLSIFCKRSNDNDSVQFNTFITVHDNSNIVTYSQEQGNEYKEKRGDKNIEE